MWVLCLNDMRSPKIEILQPVARAETKEALKAFLDREKVEGYKDGQWGKGYRAGGPLEWFNAPYDSDEHHHFVQIGSQQDRIQQAVESAREWWARTIEPLSVV